ncbi:MAG: lipopolysaccharide assembly protein LapA domain-containing protein [Paracoccaceae bacterium]
MRYLRYAFLAALAICLITVALANRGPVTLNLMPADLSALVGIAGSITVPLFVVIFAGIIAGVLIGFFWEWMREHKHRAAASNERREKERLKREMRRLRQSTAATNGDDEILALLEDKGAA